MSTGRNFATAVVLFASLLLLTVDCNMASKRLQKELRELQKDPPPGIRFDFESMAQNLDRWIVDIEGPKGTAYEGQHFKLQFKFSPEYPLKKPEVMFVGPNIPRHPNVYTNGPNSNICATILANDWSPCQTVRSICLSIISMLS